MKLQKKNAIIAIILIFGIILYGIYYFMSLTTTMDKAVLNKLNQTGVTLLLIFLALYCNLQPIR